MEQLPEELPEQDKMTTPLNKRKILIIEDDNDIRQFLQEEIGVYLRWKWLPMEFPDSKKRLRMMRT